MGGSRSALTAALALLGACGGDSRPVDPCAGGGCRGADAAGGSDGSGDAGGTPCCTSDGPAWLEIGYGETEFQPLPADGTVALQIGLQAAYMVVLALRGDGFDPERPTIRFSARLDGTLVGTLNQFGEFVPVDGALEDAGLNLVVDSNQVMTMVGQEVEVEARLTDAAGLTIETAAVIVPSM